MIIHALLTSRLALPLFDRHQAEVNRNQYGRHDYRDDGGILKGQSEHDGDKGQAERVDQNGISPGRKKFHPNDHVLFGFGFSKTRTTIPLLLIGYGLLLLSHVGDAQLLLVFSFFSWARSSVLSW